MAEDEPRRTDRPDEDDVDAPEPSADVKTPEADATTAQPGDEDAPAANDREPDAPDDGPPGEDETTPDEAGPRSVISCDTLGRWFGQVMAVNNLTVDIKPGITGLLGPNGAGKTTFMRMAMGLIKPSNGTIEVLGKRPWGNTKVLAHIGYVPEREPPWRDLSARACATQAALLSGLEQADAKRAVQDALQKVDLTDVADRTVDTFSRGMRQRLKFALALLHNPDLFILDEPLLGTDPETRMHLIQVIRELAAEGKSVLISTHVLTDVEAMTQRIMLMNRGRLMAYGDVGEIRDVLEQYPRTVRIETPTPRDLRRAMADWESVLSIEVDDASVTAKTKDPGPFYEKLQAFLAEGSVQFTAVTALDEDLESVFQYLVE